jgi:hypothetical protein
MPLMSEAVESLEKLIDDITQIVSNQTENTTGIKVQKEVTREDVENIIFILAGQLRSYAVNINNFELRNEVTYTISKLRGMADTLLLSNSITILEKAQENEANLLPYGVTPANLVAVEDLLNAFELKIALPRNAIAFKKQQTELLQVKMEDADNLLRDKMDSYVIIVKNTEQEFYTIYKNNRKIIKPSYNPLALKVLVVGPNEMPLYKVKAKIQGFSKEYRTTQKGLFQVKSLPEGMHVITLSKAGYQTQVITFPITKGERTDLNITLLPL